MLAMALGQLAAQLGGRPRAVDDDPVEML